MLYLDGCAGVASKLNFSLAYLTFRSRLLLACSFAIVAATVMFDKFAGERRFRYAANSRVDLVAKIQTRGRAGWGRSFPQGG